MQNLHFQLVNCCTTFIEYIHEEEKVNVSDNKLCNGTHFLHSYKFMKLFKHLTKQSLDYKYTYTLAYFTESEKFFDSNDLKFHTHRKKRKQQKKEQVWWHYLFTHFCSLQADMVEKMKKWFQAVLAIGFSCHFSFEKNQLCKTKS